VLQDGKVQYSCLPNGKGGIVDDLLVYRVDTETYLLVVNASNMLKDWEWMLSQNKVGAILYNASDEIAQLAVQGPLALKAMQKLTTTSVIDMEYYTFKKLDFAGVKDVIFATTGYTGSGGCEIYMANEDAVKIYEAVMEAGAEYGIKPIGLAARDTLRLEMGFCLYGNDIDDTTSPIEAGLGWITKFTDYKDFINKDIFLKQKTGINIGPNDLVIARHGLEWWTGWVLRCRTGKEYCLRPADWDKYPNIYLLRQLAGNNFPGLQGAGQFAEFPVPETAEVVCTNSSFVLYRLYKPSESEYYPGVLPLLQGEIMLVADNELVIRSEGYKQTIKLDVSTVYVGCISGGLKPGMRADIWGNRIPFSLKIWAERIKAY
jgi:hypothetical protein